MRKKYILEEKYMKNKEKNQNQWKYLKFMRC